MTFVRLGLMRSAMVSGAENTNLRAPRCDSSIEAANLASAGKRNVYRRECRLGCREPQVS